MGENEKVERLLERYGVKKANDGATEIASYDHKRKKPFIAADIERNDSIVRRIKIYLSNGDINLPSYLYLANTFVRGDTYMGMVFSVGSIEVKGRNLSKLLDMVQDERIRVLRYFDPEQHELPEPNEIFIESINMV